MYFVRASKVIKKIKNKRLTTIPLEREEKMSCCGYVFNCQHIVTNLRPHIVNCTFTQPLSRNWAFCRLSYLAHQSQSVCELYAVSWIDTSYLDVLYPLSDNYVHWILFCFHYYRRSAAALCIWLNVECLLLVQIAVLLTYYRQLAPVSYTHLTLPTIYSV